MNCIEAATLIAAYAAGEIDGLRSHLLKRHLLGCAGCAIECQRVLALRAQLRAGGIESRTHPGSSCS
jgi:anti-sigma factor RsiW